MRRSNLLYVLGTSLLLFLFGGAQAAAHGMERGAVGHAFAVQVDSVCTELVTDTGTPVVDVGFAVGSPAADDAEDVDDGTPVASEPSDDADGAAIVEEVVDEIEDATPADDAEDVDGGTPVAGTPVEDVSSVLGEDGVLDATDEAFLCQDVDGDGTFEIGIDVNGNGTLDENEILGQDENQDESLTNEELDPAVAQPDDDDD